MIKIKTHRDGMTEVLTSDGTVGFVDQQVDRVVELAQAMHEAQGYSGDTIVGSGSKPRAHGMVRTADQHAARSNAKYDTLLKALGGA